MKIAQIAPLMESVPPRLYGGTERVVSYLTEELVAQGHDVTLFASGDSITAANLVPCCTQALRLDTAVSDVVPYYMLMLDKVRSRAAEFDVLHFHIDHFHFPIFRHLPIPSLTTLHGRQDHRDCLPFFAGFSDMPLISISDAQRAPLPHANFVGTIHHGLPQDLHEASYRPNGGYLAFIGRISPEKGPVDAIRIAQSLGIPIKIAAKVDKLDESYFREVVQPMLSTEGVEFIGEISEKDKGPFLRDAIALLFPICWPEPFGLVMIEAMACGTPVLAYRAGAPLADMEMVQYHPTTLAGSGFLMSEAARGEGAYLLNAKGERFLRDYAPTKMELAARDVISRAAGSGVLDEGALAAKAQLAEEIEQGKIVPPGIADTDRQPSGQ